MTDFGPFKISLAAISSISGALGGYAFLPEPRPDARHLDIARLEYVEIEGMGYVTQQIVSSNGNIIPAEWQARIERRKQNGGSQILCNGAGLGNYSGEIDSWSLDDWAYPGDCPDVAQAGDIFEVSWTYENSYGFPVSIGGRYQLQPDGSLSATTNRQREP